MLFSSIQARFRRPFTSGSATAPTASNMSNPIHAHQGITMMRNSSPAWLVAGFRAACLFALCVASIGCSDTTIDPFDNEERYYSIYGFLDQMESEHTVRVVPITRFAEEINTPTDPGATIDAEVFSTDLTTGQRLRWTHELEYLEDGTYGHVFKARFMVQPGRSYRLEVIRSDGKRALAETRVPAPHEINIVKRGPVEYRDDSTRFFQDLTIPGIPSPWDLSAIYMWDAGLGTKRIYAPYGRKGERTDDGGWTFRVNISEDQVAVREFAQFMIDRGYMQEGDRHSVTSMGVRIRVLDQAWDPPEGIFDPEVLAQPGTMSNVENGYGFFGSIGMFEDWWRVEEHSRDWGYIPVLDDPPNS